MPHPEFGFAVQRAGSQAAQAGGIDQCPRFNSVRQCEAEVRRVRMVPSKPITRRSSDRRPILIPMDTAPSGFSLNRVEGCPTRPRTLSPLRSSPPSSRRLDNHGHCLCGQTGHPRQIGLGQPAMATQQRYHQTLIILANADLIAAMGRMRSVIAYR